MVECILNRYKALGFRPRGEKFSIWVNLQWGTNICESWLGNKFVNKEVQEKSSYNWYNIQNRELCARVWWMSPRLSCAEGLTPSLRCYWKVVKSLRGGGFRMRVRSLGACPWRGYWDLAPTFVFASWPPWGEKLALPGTRTMMHCFPTARKW